MFDLRYWYGGQYIFDLYMEEFFMEQKEISEDSELTSPENDSLKTFSKYQAIEYIVKNCAGNSEWAEAGAFNQICVIVNSDNSEKFSLCQLRAMVSRADNN